MLQAAGFLSVDLDKGLLRDNSVAPVVNLGVELMQARTADEFASHLGRALRKAFFGANSLVDDIIEAQNSPNRIEADPTLTRKFLWYSVFLYIP